jgi:hypothetical protein
MIRPLPVSLLVLLAGCPSGGSESGNAATVWLAPDGAETRLRLQELEPPPF